MKRGCLAASLVTLLSLGGCAYRELYQEDLCLAEQANAGATSPAPCPPRDQVLSDPYVGGSSTCDDQLVSVDEGPILVPDGGYGPRCCYLATYRTKYCLPE